MYCSRVTGNSLTHEKKELLLNLNCLGFLHLDVTLLINVFSANPNLQLTSIFIKNQYLRYRLHLTAIDRH